ncbi:MAG TPA: LEA type 2 family protein [Tepidisphaeraceae bacterium]|jgi:LEA14-like dessication related protein|nr:LEA type 2 family protein [Tepidisphaeraceae bacterium]
MITSTLRMLVLVPFCLLSLACAGAGLEKPTAAVKGMSLGAINATGLTMNFDVDVTNPNAFAVPLTAADYGLSISGTKVLDGKAEPGGELPAKGTRSLVLPVAVTFENLLAAEQALVKTGGNIPFSLDAGLSAGRGTALLGQSVRVPLSYSGTLPLRDVLNDPKILLQSPAARALAQKVIGNALGGTLGR